MVENEGGRPTRAALGNGLDLAAQRDILLLAGAMGTAALTVAVFCADIMLPRGVAAAMLYVLPVTAAIWAPKPWYLPAVAIVATALTLAGDFFSPPGDGHWYPFANRILALGLIWGTTGLGVAYRRSRGALGEVEARIRALLESAPEGVILADAGGRMQMANPRAHELFGYPPGELIGRNVDELVPAAARAGHRQHRADYLVNPSPRPMGDGMALLGERRDGSRFPVEIGLTYVDEGPNQLVMAFISDVTQRRRAEERMREYARQLERSNRELEDFAFIASHDLQEPLRKVQAFGERLTTKYAADLPEQGRDYVARMADAASRMRVLIDDLLSYSRVTTQGHPFVPVDMDAVMAAVARDLELRRADVDGRIRWQGLGTVDGDESQLRQLLLNLVGNALKFHREGVPPEVTVAARADREAGTYTLTVDDNGIGLEVEHAGRIFEIFQRLHGRTAYEGTGIGLAICRKIADRHRGTIRAAGAPGEGTTFTLELPLHQTTAEGGPADGA